MANYGFTSSDEVKLSNTIFPIGVYKVHATDQVDVSTGIKVTYDILTGKNKGDVVEIWYNTLSENETQANIAKVQFKRIGDIMGMPISESAPVKGRVFVVDVRINEKKPEYTNVHRYYKESYNDLDPDRVVVEKAKEAF